MYSEKNDAVKRAGSKVFFGDFGGIVLILWECFAVFEK
jgi:hypothetical protein